MINSTFSLHRPLSKKGPEKCQNGRHAGVKWTPWARKWLQSSHRARPGEPKIIPSRPQPPVRAPMVMPRERFARQCAQKSQKLRPILHQHVTSLPKCSQNIAKYMLNTVLVRYHYLRYKNHAWQLYTTMDLRLH